MANIDMDAADIIAKVIVNSFSSKREKRIESFAKQQTRHTIREQFRKWLNDNPHIYDLALKYSLEAKRSGQRNFGMKAVVERIRWHTGVETKGEPVKINNTYTSRLARLLMLRHPELRGFFRTRKLKRD